MCGSNRLNSGNVLSNSSRTRTSPSAAVGSKRRTGARLSATTALTSLERLGK